MKKIYKFFTVTALVAGTLFQSCETTELEKIDNPNALTEGDAQFLLNSIQSSYRAAQVTFNDRSSELTRIDYMNGRNYFSNYSDATMNGVWGALYSSIIPDLKEIEELDAANENLDLRMHVAMSKTLQAHLIMQLVDFLGDIIPLEETGDPFGNPFPELTTDAGASMYNTALNLLTEAETLFNEDPPSIGVQDFYYGDPDSSGEQTDESAGQWLRFVNTLRMRAAITTGDLATFNTIEATGNYIQDSADDFEFRFGTDVSPTNLRHQDYVADYTDSGANIYQSNWLMNHMLQSNDPRIRYYFYRQSACTPGASCNEEGDGQTLSCSLQGAPAHLLGTPTEDIWCYLEDGYWGRLNGNDEGAPPDNFGRTAVGVYPSYGRFDDDSFEGLVLDAGGEGRGIEPIILASYVDFWKAEAALTSGDVSSALAHMQTGLNKHIAKVQEFIAADGGADTDFVPTATNITDFVTSISNAFTAGDTDDRWNILSEQYFVTLYGGGADAHNYYRRTGYPTTLSANIDPNPGNYIRTFLYPNNEVTPNPNVNQRTNNDDAVFWNTQPLPSAN